MTVESSLILVSRGRLELLRNLLNSVRATTVLPFEVFVGCDEDDFSYLEVQDLLKQDYPFLTLVFRPRRENLHEYMTELAHMSSGTLLFVLNDDCVLTNTGWDRLAKARLEAFGDVVMGQTNDDSIDKCGDYASFPIISRKAFNKLGFLLEESCGNHGADIITTRIYREAGKLIRLPEVEISH
ncbi:MAG: glycosyltransferase family 2 protein, partial [Nitrososphaerales archaeon]